MKAMLLNAICDLNENPLITVNLPNPVPGEREILVKVSVCGVCHTELDEIEGRTPPPSLPIVLGHQVVGKVEKVGSGANKYKIGDRVGITWIYSACGKCRFCLQGDENLCKEFKATGQDANGGYAEYMTVKEDFAFPIPDEFSDVHAAPLLCAGAIGYRSLRLTGIKDGQSLGLTGFGAVWAGDTGDEPPEIIDSIIDTTPAWRPVVEALKNLKSNGRLVINAIRKEEKDKDYLLKLDYPLHLWMEKEIKSVANVASRDVSEFLQLAAKIPIKPEIQEFSLEEANTALLELKERKILGAKVLRIDF